MIKEGIININKPPGLTSHDCVQAVRKWAGVRRVGHTGTLDPMATGVLPICIGSAARIMEYLELDLKTYRCGMAIGLSTETQDVWGAVCADRRAELKRAQNGAARLTEERIREAFAGFAGIIEQTPPKYSALKVDGKRLYEYARAGEPVQIKARKVFIESLVIRHVDLAELTVTFDVTCSKGTYIRAICHEAGEILGCGAAMNGLIRLSSGVFSIEQAVPLAALAAPDADGQRREEQRTALIAAPDVPLVHFGKAILEQAQAGRFTNGGAVSRHDAQIEREPAYQHKDPPFPFREAYKRTYNVYERTDDAPRFLGVAFYDPATERLLPDKIFAGQ